MCVKVRRALVVKTLAVVTVAGMAAAVAVVVKVNVQTVAVAVAMAEVTVAAASAAATVAVLHATTIATVNFNPRVNTARALHRAKAAAVVLAWGNPQALPMSHGRIAHQQDNLTPCAPASI